MVPAVPTFSTSRVKETPDSPIFTVAGWALIASALVSYARAKAEALHTELRVGVLERAERLLILTAGALFGLMVLALWIVAIGSTVTVIQRFARAYRELDRLGTEDGPGLGEHP